MLESVVPGIGRAVVEHLFEDGVAEALVHFRVQQAAVVVEKGEPVGEVLRRITGFLPEDMNPIIGLYPIFFAMAFQWNSFPGAYGYASSSIFSTNNTRQVVNALSEYFITHERKQLKKAWFFAGTLICFHIGVAFSWITHQFMGIRSIWLCAVPLLFSAVLVAMELRLDRAEKTKSPAFHTVLAKKSH